MADKRTQCVAAWCDWSLLCMAKSAQFGSSTVMGSDSLSTPVRNMINGAVPGRHKYLIGAVEGSNVVQNIVHPYSLASGMTMNRSVWKWQRFINMALR